MSQVVIPDSTSLAGLSEMLKLVAVYRLFNDCCVNSADDQE
ncbi:hypothetical protein QF042_002178 [Pedobacter sp. W3I1]|jgi:hypothetical protein|nr:hypothetical protein [Pedobacter sp. W3I1]